MKTMDVDKLKSDLRRDEGVRLKPYRDTVGKLTIGIGRNLDDMGISDDEAMAMLENDVSRIVQELDFRLPWWRDMPEPGQRALANMAFNLGVPRMLQFRMMIAALEAEDYTAAATEATDSKWAEQVGDRAKRIAALFMECAE